MARKTLLNESEIRRFMKLANIKPVGDQRLEEMYNVSDYKAAGKRDYEDDMDEQVEEPGAKMDMADDAPADDMEMDMDEPEMDMDEPEMDMADDADLGVKINLEDFLSALESALEDVTGEEVSTDMDMDDEGADDEEMEMDLKMGDEGGDDDEPAMDMEMDMDDDAAMRDDEEEPGMRDSMMEEKVNRIAARVAARLVKENKKASNIDGLTERIFQKLTNK
jgi:hypothetical protein